MKRSFTICVILALVFGYASASPAIAAGPYTLTDLGTLGGGSDSGAIAINEAGQVIGASFGHALVWEDAVMTDLGTLGGSFSEPVAINEAGQVIGRSSVAGNTSWHAFVWQDGVMTDLSLGGSGSRAIAINEAGQVIGYSHLAGDASLHAFVWQDGIMTDLGTLGGGNSSPVAINEAGQVIGSAYLAGDASRHAFVWEGGVMTDLGTLGGISAPLAINEAGQVAGYSYLADGNFHAFVWEDGVMTDLGTLGGSDSQANAINEAGQVIGYSLLAGDASGHAFVWEDGVMTDLGTLGGSFSQAIAINEVGQVIGSNYLANGHTRGFVWEDGVMTDLSLGGGNSYARAINEAGQVIGRSDIAGNAGYHAFVWEDGVMTDLGTLGGSESDPLAINEAGQVIGVSTLAGDTGDPNYHAFLARSLLGITPAGSDVTVSPGHGTTLTFANVSSEGQTTVRTSSSAPPLPAGFSLGDPPTFYDINTNATYSPPVTVCITYDPAHYSDPANLHLLHYENSEWVDATTSNDTTNHIICGQVSSLSPFAVAERAIYNFSGFFPPVDNLPTLNVVQAGSAVPVKFSLSGDQGLSIFEAGYPVSQGIACDSAAAVDNIEQTVTAGNSGLQYDATTDTYTYVWKTQKGWAGTCRQLIVRLDDGTDHIANFKFKK